MLIFISICVFLLLLAVFAGLVLWVKAVFTDGGEDGPPQLFIIFIIMIADLGSMGYIFYNGIVRLLGKG